MVVKLFREMILLFGIYYIGEGIQQMTNMPIPGNLIGMILLFILLSTHVLRLEQISTISDFLLGHMPFFFIPAGVALMSSFSLIADIWLQILLLCLFTTFLTMGISGWAVQFFMKRKVVRK